MADRSIRVVISAVVSQFQAGMAQAATTARTFGNQLVATSTMAQKHSESFTLMGAAAAAAGAGILAGLGSATGAAISFESAFANVRKTVEGSDEELDALAVALRKMATEIPVTVEGLSDIAALGGQMGIPVQSLEEFTHTVAILSATIDGLPVEDAASALARISTIMDLPDSQFSNLAATLVDLGNKGNSTEADILSLGQRITASGKIAGLTAGEILGFASALSDVLPAGTAELGGTAFNMTLADMVKAVKGGGEELEKFGAIAQMTGEDFAQTFSNEPVEAIGLFLEGLAAIHRSGGDVFTTLENVGVEGQRQSMALLSLALAGDKLSEQLGIQAEAWEENNAHLTEAEKRFSTFQSQLDITKNKVNDAKIEIGSFIATAARPFVAVIGEMAGGLAGLPGPVQASIAAVGGLAGVVAVLGGGFLILLPRIAATKAAITALTAQSALAAGAMSALGTAARLSLGGVIVGAAFAARNALEGLVDTIAEAVGGSSKLDQALEMDRQGASAGAIRYFTGVDIAAAKAGKGIDSAGKAAAGAVPGVDALGDEMGDLAINAEVAASATAGLALSFDSLADSQLGHTPAESVQALEDRLSDAHHKLKELKNEDPPVFDRDKWFPSVGKTSLEDMQKDRDKFLRNQAQQEAEFYNDQANESAKAAEDRARDISRTQRDIATLQKELRDAKRSALQVLMESSVENTEILGQFNQDIGTLVESGEMVLARKFMEWGPASAFALREAVAMGVGSDGFGRFRGIVGEAIDEEKRVIDEDHWSKWPANFEEQGRKAGDGAVTGLDTGLKGLLTAAKKAGDYLNEGLLEVFLNVKAGLESTGSEIVTRFENTSGNLVTIFRTAAGELKVQVNNVNGDLRSINDVTFDPLTLTVEGLASILDISKKHAKELLQHLRDIDQMRVMTEILLQPKWLPEDQTELNPFGPGARVPPSTSSSPSTEGSLGDVLLGRAAGGPVRKGWPYWVGEDGPEPFIPAMDGRILSKQEAASAVATHPMTIAASLPPSGVGGSMSDNTAMVSELRALRRDFKEMEFDLKLDRQTFAKAASRSMHERAMAR